MYNGASEALKDSISNQSKLHSENESLKVKVKRMAFDSIQDMNQIGGLQEENARLNAEVERLTKAVMHSPAAQLKLKELEGKTTFDEINGNDGNPNE
jgi:serine protease inhibitor